MCSDFGFVAFTSKYRGRKKDDGFPWFGLSFATFCVSYKAKCVADSTVLSFDHTQAAQAHGATGWPGVQRFKITRMHGASVSSK